MTRREIGKRTMTFIWILIVASAAVVVVRAEEKHPVALEDLMKVKSVADPAISPDGREVIFTVTAWEPEGGEAGVSAVEPTRMSSVSHVFRVDTKDGQTRQLTFGEKGEGAPAWSPDGRWISFLAARRDDSPSSGDARAWGDPVDTDEPNPKPQPQPKPQIWLLRAEGGEAFRLSDAREGVAAYAWSPDSHSIAFTTKDPLSDDQRARRDRKDDPVVFEGDTRMVHLWTVDLGTRESRQRTRGTAFTVRGAPSWSPDGRLLAFAAAPTLLLRDEREDLYLLSVDSDDVERITTNRGPDQSPAFSPDGSSIAYLSTPNGNEPLPDGTQTADLRNARLTLYDVSKKMVRDLGSASFDRIPGDPVWSRDGKRILFVAGDRAFYDVYAYDLASASYSKLTERAVVHPGTLSVSLGPGSSESGESGERSRQTPFVAFVRESSEWPAEIFVAGSHFDDGRRLTTTNPQATSFELGATQVITWKSSDGLEVEGVLLEPVGYQPGRRYPLLVVPHGGPTGAYVDGFLVRYGDGGQHWAGQGWAVLYPNPRGSTNYGEAFMRGNLADWGGGDYRDIMSGVDALVARGIADADRLAIQGWSYGGYMTCWTITQTTRFKAAMIGAGLTDLVSMYGTNDVPNYLATFFTGTLSPETEQLYRERSGLTHVDRVSTPTLILHGGSDDRVPIGQPMEFYRALEDRGVAAELVFYPREGHGFREYYHRLDRMKRQYEWITSHTFVAQREP